MLTTPKILVVVISTIFIGVISKIVCYLIEKNNKKNYSLYIGDFCIDDFSNNYVTPRVKNTDIAIDNIIKNFELLD